jgi:hypothetical protein
MIQVFDVLTEEKFQRELRTKESRVLELEGEILQVASQLRETNDLMSKTHADNESLSQENEALVVELKTKLRKPMNAPAVEPLDATSTTNIPIIVPIQNTSMNETPFIATPVTSPISSNGENTMVIII